MATLLGSQGRILVTFAGPGGPDENPNFPAHLRGEQWVRRANVRDLIPWCEEIHQRWIKAGTDNMPKMIAAQRAEYVRQLHLRTPAPDDITAELWSAPGRIKMLELAFRKTWPDLTAEQVSALADDLAPFEAKRVAYYASGLFPENQLAAVFADVPPAPAVSIPAGVAVGPADGENDDVLAGPANGNGGGDEMPTFGGGTVPGPLRAAPAGATFG